jgi:hypothetical protein
MKTLLIRGQSYHVSRPFFGSIHSRWVDQALKPQFRRVDQRLAFTSAEPHCRTGRTHALVVCADRIRALAVDTGLVACTGRIHG